MDSNVTKRYYELLYKKYCMINAHVKFETNLKTDIEVTNHLLQTYENHIPCIYIYKQHKKLYRFTVIKYRIAIHHGIPSVPLSTTPITPLLVVGIKDRKPEEKANKGKHGPLSESKYYR